MTLPELTIQQINKSIENIDLALAIMAVDENLQVHFSYQPASNSYRVTLNSNNEPQEIFIGTNLIQAVAVFNHALKSPVTIQPVIPLNKCVKPADHILHELIEELTKIVQGGMGNTELLVSYGLLRRQVIRFHHTHFITPVARMLIKKYQLKWADKMSKDSPLRRQYFPSEDYINLLNRANKTNLTKYQQLQAFVKSLPERHQIIPTPDLTQL